MALILGICWPLQSNTIRKHSVSNTFGMVRDGRKRAHQGWDLLAYPGTPIYAVGDGNLKYVRPSGDYGMLVIQEFTFHGRRYYAAYAHLSSVCVSEDMDVVMGEIIGWSGNTGNASAMSGDDQHLHFEIRTVERAGHGLGGRVDPRDLYGFVPLSFTVMDHRLMTGRALSSAPGLKVAELNSL
jgi:murein DD-endopeptidase MepM/ murein hydrolase activator NlpD